MAGFRGVSALRVPRLFSRILISKEYIIQNFCNSLSHLPTLLILRLISRDTIASYFAISPLDWYTWDRKYRLYSNNFTDKQAIYSSQGGLTWRDTGEIVTKIYSFIGNNEKQSGTGWERRGRGEGRCYYNLATST